MLAGNFILGKSAATFDVVCNAQQDGTEQSFEIDALNLQGNAADGQAVPEEPPISQQ